MEPKDFIGPGLTVGAALVIYLLNEGARRAKLLAQEAEITTLKAEIDKLKGTRADYVELRVRIEDIERRLTVHKLDLKAEIAELRRKIDGK